MRSLALLAALSLVLGAAATDAGVPAEILAVPEASGPPQTPTCREALGLPPPEPATPAPEPTTADPDPEPTTPEPVPDLTGFVHGDPGRLPVQALEGDPEAIRRVRAVFQRAEAGERIRLSFFGASHTGADWWTGHMRRLLQDRWGDLGHGFVMPAALYRGYRGQDVNLCRTDGWRSDWAGRRGGREDGLLGFAGMSVSSSDPEDFGWIQTTVTNPHGRKVEWFDVYTLGHPDGGSLRVEVDGASTRTIATSSPTVRLQRTRVLVPDGPHRLTLAPVGDGEVRIFGVSLERSGGGVLVDAMGVRGRRARDWLTWDSELAADGLRSLDPDLVVLAYGTNEAADSKYAMDAYRADLAAVLEQLKRRAPEGTPCVLVGPSDRGKQRRGRWTTWPRTVDVAQVQRELAPIAGCAFWDWQQATGGPGSMVPWIYLDPPLASRDGIHHTRAGYELMAEHFLKALGAVE